MNQIEKYIEINLEKRFGKPVIKGTHISVNDILNWMANGMDKEAIIKDFPVLNENQINAFLTYAAMREFKINIAS